MPKFGLIGYPLEGSLSPRLFEAAYGGRWKYDLIEESSFEVAGSRFLAEYDAVNVTAPFKEEACRFADVLSPECRETGAANILVRGEGGVCAFNSDYLAVRMLIMDLGVEPGGRALVVGYGGAGKAAAAAAASLGFETVVCNRTLSKAPGIRPLGQLGELAESSDIVFYTLPCILPEAEGMLCDILVDVSYRSSRLQDTADAGKYVSGREWLLRQAVVGYPLMTGQPPALSAMMSVLMH